jgi:PAS domain S-box-containing protein
MARHFCARQDIISKEYMHRSLQRNVTIGFGAALLMLGLIALMGIKSLRQFVAAEQWEEHTRQVLLELSDTSGELSNTEIAADGYVISGMPQSLRSYQRAADMVGRHLQVLQQLTADNPGQQHRLHELKPLVQKKLDLLATILAAREHGGFSDGQQLIIGGEGTLLGVQTQQLLQQMREVEDGLLKVRNAAAIGSARTTMVMIPCGGALAVVLAAVAGLLIRRDIRARARAEEELTRFFTLSLDMMCIADANGHFTRLSPVWSRTLGFSAAELISTPHIEFVHPEDRESTASEWQKLSNGMPSEQFENRYRGKDGSYRWLMWTAVSSPDEGSIYAAARDITERKHSEQALREAEERLRLLVESVKDYAIFVLDLDGCVASWNAGAQRLNGYEPQEILGQHFSRFYLPEEVTNGKPQLELRTVIESGRYEEEGWRVRKDGSRFWANVVISAVREPSGKLRGFAKVVRDVSERKRADDEIRALNGRLERHATQLQAANTELEAFSYSVSHDLRAPLRSIDGFSMALLEDHAQSLDADGRDYLRRVRAATQRMSQLIDDILNLARVSRAQMTRATVDLSEMARAVVAELQKTEPDRQVEIDITGGLSIEGDAHLLRVVLDNLLANAWKFTSKQKQARIEFGSAGANGSRAFYVRDNGAGFDMTYASKLFGAFQRLHGTGEFPGTGVGLATVQRIINRHGGRIWAEAEVDKGAIFRFTL